MATLGEWIEGARPRTLSAAIAPIAVGLGIALGQGDAQITQVLLALIVALALQIGVNYANDYSDGVRGTDDVRVGPIRLVGQGLAQPSQVRSAAFGCFAIAAVAGLLLTWSIQQWWLLLVGAASMLAAWLYTGGPRPYGYAGLGEVFVLVFFGLVPVVGTVYVQTLRIEPTAVIAGLGVGLLSCAILLANNLRDIPTDAQVGKRTLAVRVGDKATRYLYLAINAIAFLLVFVFLAQPWTLLALLALPLAIRSVRIVLGGAKGRALIPILRMSGVTLLIYGVLLGVGFAIGPVLGTG